MSNVLNQLSELLKFERREKAFQAKRNISRCVEELNNLGYKAEESELEAAWELADRFVFVLRSEQRSVCIFECVKGKEFSAITLWTDLTGDVRGTVRLAEAYVAREDV